MKYTASIIILTYKQLDLLIMQLLSLTAQKTKASYEIIITEDGSDSFNDSRVQKIIKKSSLPFKYAYQPDIGRRMSHARNNGIKISDGSILIFLDGDMLPDINFIEKHVRSHKNANLLIAGNRIRRNFNSIASNISADTNINLILKKLKTDTIDEESKSRQINEERKRQQYIDSNNSWRAVFGCNFSVSNSQYVIFDEAFSGWGVEDWDLAYRLIKFHNYQSKYNRKILAYEIETGKVGNVFRENNHEEIVQFLKNELYFFDKYPELNPNEILWFLPKLNLNKSNNKWEVIKNHQPINSKELNRLIKNTKDWLKQNCSY